MRSLSLSLALSLSACGSTAPPSTASPQPLAYLELTTGGAAQTDTLPLVIALHGRGDDADGFTRAFRDMPTPAHVFLLRAPIEEGDGDAWFTFQHPNDPSAGSAGTPVGPWTHVAHDLDALSDRIVVTIDAITAQRSTRGLPIVTGFSQGAMLCYSLALRHPTHFSAIFPVSGALVTELFRTDPGDPAHTPPIIAFHGTRDEVIPIDAEQDAVDRLRARGIHEELRPHDATHWLDGEMRADLWVAIAASARQ